MKRPGEEAVVRKDRRVEEGFHDRVSGARGDTA